MSAVTNQRVCLHCGTSFRPTVHRPDFCCAGCQFVYRLIAENGLGQFYDLQESGVAPAPATVFQPRDYSWLEDLLRDGRDTLTLEVQGLSCLGCAWLIERLFARIPGALTIHVDPALGRLEMRWEPGVFAPLAFARELQSFGYLLGPVGAASRPTSRALSLRLGLCAAFAMNTMLFTLPHYLGMEASFAFAPLFARLSLILGTLSFLVGGSYFFIRSWHSLRRGVLHLDFPISLGLIAAYAGSVFAWWRRADGFVYFDFVSTFTFLMLAGRWLQQKVIDRNRRQLLDAPGNTVTVRTPKGEKIDAAQLAVGDAFVVAPGQIVPVLARLRSANAALGLEWISGESDAATARRGRLVIAGATNVGTASIELEARETWANSLLAKLLQTAPTGTSRDLVFERFLRGYLVVILALAFASLCGWWVATGTLLPALQVFISVLVVSCPCASGVALPLCRDLAAARLRRLGVFIRESEIWSRLDRVRKIIFDKTGTLTIETISLLNPEALYRLSAAERSMLLGLVLESRHPVGSCLREQLLADGVEPAVCGPVLETIGFGVETIAQEMHWRLGRSPWAAGMASTVAGDCFFTRNGAVLAAFRFGELARDDAREEVDALQEQGLVVHILSGDRSAKVAAMAERLGLPQPQCHGELSPEQKAAEVRTLDARDTLYLGDGANDSLAFDAAWIRGTPAIDRGLLEQKADFYFLGRSLAGVRSLLCVGALRRRAARGVVGFAVAYNVLAGALCLAGFMSPLLAAILMPASSLISLAIVLLTFRRSQSTSVS